MSLPPARASYPSALLGGASSPREAALREAPRVERRLAERLGPPGAAWRARFVSASRSEGGALLFEATCGATGRRVAAKLFARPSRARAEFDAAEARGAGGAALARPLFCDEGMGLLVSDWVAGRTLAQALARGGGREGLGAAGRWLRRFHGEGQGRPRVFQPLAVLADVCDAAAALSAEMPAAERAAFRRAVERLVERASRTLPGLYRPVRLHGDFHSGNVILSSGGPVALDLTQARVGPREGDLARMTVQLAISAEVEPEASGLDPGLGLGAAREAFLRGYGLGRGGRARLGLREGAELLRRWQVASRSQAPRPGRAEAVQAILARRGWLVLALATLGEALPEPDRRGGAAVAVVAAAA